MVFNFITKLVLISCVIKSKVTWRPLLPNIQCMQVPLTNVPSVLDLYAFDVVSSGGSTFSEELMNCARNLSTTVSTPKNQTQPISTQFDPNLETIQNALKYDKKLHYPSVLEYVKVCTIMDAHESENTVISKQYGVKDAQNAKEQAVLLGIASTIMPALLTKYPDFLGIDSTGCHNSLNFPNTAFMVRSNEPRGRIVATFVSDKETTPVVDLMFESVGFSCFMLGFAKFGLIILTSTG
ncbi:hypothetical protein C2G38_2040712 [Gigaspora rosea]|uniref:ZSWIM1/3 RNaseH-like domain-containing protein n=1 Tax=Gigaspora rosea TaxID=44941 RepID=A0A397UX49_9GLOM|nr:hypothetical protein C2G38_2040712 [Gigaspora rosea]